MMCVCNKIDLDGKWMDGKWIEWMWMWKVDWVDLKSGAVPDLTINSITIRYREYSNQISLI